MEKIKMTRKHTSTYHNRPLFPKAFYEFWSSLLRSYLKIKILVQDQGGAEFLAAGILKYVEDLKRGPNAEIGPKDYFETASKLVEDQLLASTELQMQEKIKIYQKLLKALAIVILEGKKRRDDDGPNADRK